MIILRGPREILLDAAVAGARPATLGTSVGAVSMGDVATTGVTALYDDDAAERQPPWLIVVGSDELRDFFAWTSTYLPQWSPLTSTSVVMHRSDPYLSQILGRSRPRVPSFKLRRGLAGAIIAEALVEAQGAGRVSFPSVIATRNTFSYAAARALCLYEKPEFGVLLKRFEGLDDLFETPHRAARETALNWLWQPLAAAIASHSMDSLIPVTGMAGFAQSVLSEEFPRWALHDASFGALLRRLRDRKDRREDLVADIERACIDAGRGRAEPEVAAMAAFLMAEVSEAPLSHTETLAGMLDWHSSAMLWYGFTSAYRGTRVGEAKVEALLTRLAVELGMPTATPQDVAAEEVLSLGSRPEGAVSVRTGSLILQVALAPNVVVPVRTAPSVTAVSSAVSKDVVERNRAFEEAVAKLRLLLLVQGGNETPASLFPRWSVGSKSAKKKSK